MANKFIDLDTAYVADQAGGGSITPGGDLSGNSTSQTVIGLRGRPMQADAPTNGQAVVWNGSAWAPGNVAGSGAPVGASYITLSADATLTSERVLTAGTNISLVDDGAGGALTISNTYSYTPVDATTSLKGILTLANDLGGTAALPTVLKINGTSVASGATSGQILRATGTNAASFGALNLANASSVTGVLPSGNLPTTSTSAYGVLKLGGDLAGSAASQTVAKVNGTTITGTPSTGYILTATSGTAASWQAPASGAGDASTIAKGVVQLAGDIAGTATNVIVDGIQGTPVSATTPTTGQVLQFDGTSYTPITMSSSSASYLTLGLDASLPNERVLTAGTNISFSDTGANGTLTINNTYVPPDAGTSVKGIVQLAGDIGGTATSVMVLGLRNIALSATAPTSGQLLGYNGTNWIPTTFAPSDATTGAKGIVQLATDLGGTAAAPTVVALTGTGTTGYLQIKCPEMRDQSVSNLDRRSKSYYVQTTNATLTTIATVAHATANTAMFVSAVIVGKKSDGSQAASYVRTALYRNVAGTLYLTGSVQDGGTTEDDVLWNATISFSGTNISVQVQGLAATTVNWTAYVSTHVGS